MTDDLVKRGRLLAQRSIDGDLRGTALQMADRIEALQAERDALAAEVERLRGELIHKSAMLDTYECFGMGINKPGALTRRLAERRAALEEGKG